MLFGCGQAGQERPEHESAGPVQQSQRDPGITEKRVVGHHDEVAQQRDRDTGADRGAVDGRNGRERQPCHHPEQFLVGVEHRVA
jgi:predicted urease superfamily metal-dependent hydrolase